MNSLSIRNCPTVCLAYKLILITLARVTGWPFSARRILGPNLFPFTSTVSRAKRCTVPASVVLTGSHEDGTPLLCIHIDHDWHHRHDLHFAQPDQGHQSSRNPYARCRYG